VQVEAPVSGGYSAAFDVHATLTRMLGSMVIGHQVVQRGESREKRLWAAVWVMAPFPREALPLAGVMGLLSQGGRHRHLGGCQPGLPARCLCLAPAPAALPVSHPGAVRYVVGTVAAPWPSGTHAPALALARSGPPGGPLRAPGLAPRRRERHQLSGQRMERVVETVAAAGPRAPRPPPARRAVNTIGQDAAAPLRRLRLERGLGPRSG
jgi:hypothetical protein